MARKSSMSLMRGVPVRAIISGRVRRARMRSAIWSTCRDRSELLFLMKCASSTTMPPKPRSPSQPACRSGTVVDDDDVGEAVDRLAVSVHDRRRATGGPHAGLAGPVHLHHVGHDHEQRVGVDRLGGQQRLGRLAQAGLVGEQERAVTVLGGGHQLGLVVHQLEPAPDRVGRRLGQAMHEVAPPDASSKARKSGPSSPSWRARRVRGRTGLGAGEVGSEERAGQLARRDRSRHHTPVGDVRGVLLGLGLLRLQLDAGGHLQLRIRATVSLETTASSASKSKNDGFRAAVVARIVPMPSRRLTCSVILASLPERSALTRARS